MGDGIMALFGAPLAHEDHAVRACYAALRMQEGVQKYAEEVRRTHGAVVKIRVGLNSGEVVVRAIGSDLHMDYTAVGQTTHLAARVEQLAEPGTTLLTPATLALAEDFVQMKSLGPMRVKGLSDAVEVYELVGANAARSRFQAHAARGLTKFVGRANEIAQLAEALDLARRGRGQVVGAVGEPGVGKSRLLWEFAHSHRTDGSLVLEAASVSYGKAITYLPVSELLRGYFQIEPRDDTRKIREKVTDKLLSLDRALEAALPALLALLDVSVDDESWTGLAPPQRRQRTLDAVKGLMLRESHGQPLVVIFEDLHWIDGETQAVLDGLVESLPTARLLLLVNYRPEYRHGWGSKTYYRQVQLDALPAARTEELLETLLGNDRSLVPLKRLLTERTDGNPFFLEESLRALVETMALDGTPGAYRATRALGGLQMPATTQAIVAARVDRLDTEDKRLLQAASVIGKDVSLVLLQAILDRPESELRQSLARLQAAEFLYETRLFPEVEYTFKHALTHEVTYGGLLRERRRELHTRIVPPSRCSTGDASASRSSGSPITRCMVSSGRQRSSMPGKPACGPSDVRLTERPAPPTSKRCGLSSACRRRAKTRSKRSTYASRFGRRCCRWVILDRSPGCCRLPRDQPPRSVTIIVKRGPASTSASRITREQSTKPRCIHFRRLTLWAKRSAMSAFRP
jgi:hypothetical protein